MTEQEAISVLESNLDLIKKLDGKVVGTLGRAIEVALPALEKQIPKKPTDTWENNIDRRRNHLCRWACPECGTFLGFENKHCTNCGIKIEWTFIA